jgi:hypothetical protein
MVDFRSTMTALGEDERKGAAEIDSALRLTPETPGAL